MLLFKSFVLVGILLLSSVASADDTPIEVVSTSGASVMVSPSELKRSYLALVQRKSNHASKVITNEDGSVAITRPFFQYNGKMLRIDWNYTDARGVCKRFGFDKNVGRESETILADTTIAILNEDGRLSDLIAAENPPTHEQRRVLETVACQ